MTSTELKDKLKKLIPQIYKKIKKSEIAAAEYDELTKFPELKSILVDLLTVDFNIFIGSIDWVAPRPTTFRINLKNGQSFYLIWNERSWIAQVEGKRYYLLNLPEEQRAAQSIATILRYGTKDEAAATTTPPSEEPAAEEPAAEEPAAEEPAAEEPVAEGTVDKTNETLRGLTGRQMQNLMRIIRKHQEGELSKLQALVLIRGGYGLNDIDANALLNTNEPQIMSTDNTELPLQESKFKINEAGLTASVLQKRPARIPVFIQKFLNNNSFELEDGKTIKLKSIEIDNKLFDKNSSQSKLEQALTNASKINVTGIVDDKEVTLPSGKLLKSAEFGGGKGSGGGSENTDLAESAQAIVNSIRYNVLKRDITEKDLTSKNFSLAAATSDTTSTPKQAEDFLNSSPEWAKSSILTANNLAASYPGKFEFHRGSSFVNKINTAAKSALKNSGETGNINKWNPADIWMVSPKAKSIEFPTEINELNALIKKLFDNKELIGVSLKKTSVAKVDVLNNSPKQVYTYESVSSSPSSKDAYIQYSNGKIQFRTFDDMTGFQGEIIGTEAKHGKVSLGLINKILQKVGLSETTNPDELRDIIKNTPNNISFKKTFKSLFDKYVQGDFNEFYKEASNDKKYSKFLALNLIDIVSKSPSKKRNIFVSSLINYAKSQSDISSVFIKVS